MSSKIIKYAMTLIMLSGTPACELAGVIDAVEKRQEGARYGKEVFENRFPVILSAILEALNRDILEGKSFEGEPVQMLSLPHHLPDADSTPSVLDKDFESGVPRKFSIDRAKRSYDNGNELIVGGLMVILLTEDGYEISFPESLALTALWDETAVTVASREFEFSGHMSAHGAIRVTPTGPASDEDLAGWPSLDGKVAYQGSITLRDMDDYLVLFDGTLTFSGTKVTYASTWGDGTISGQFELLESEPTTGTDDDGPLASCVDDRSAATGICDAFTGSEFLTEATCPATPNLMCPEEGRIGACTFGIDGRRESIAYYYENQPLTIEELASNCGELNGEWSE